MVVFPGSLFTPSLRDGLLTVLIVSQTQKRSGYVRCRHYVTLAFPLVCNSRRVNGNSTYITA